MKPTIWRLLNLTALLGPTTTVLLVPNTMTLQEQVSVGLVSTLAGLYVAYAVLREFLDPIDNQTAPDAERYFPAEPLPTTRDIGGPRWGWIAAQVLVFVTVVYLVLPANALLAHADPAATEEARLAMGGSLLVGGVATLLFATISMHLSLWRNRRDERRQDGASLRLDAIEGPADYHRVIPATADPRP